MAYVHPTLSTLTFQENVKISGKRLLLKIQLR